MLRFIVLLLVLLNSFHIHGQSYQRMIGINMVEMVSQFVPFTDGVEKSGPFQLIFRSGNDGRMFNFKFGAGSTTIEDDGYANLLFGYLKMTDFGDKFYYYTSYNFMLSSGRYNIPSEERTFFGDNSSLGAHFEWGVGYKLSERISICTELQALFSFGDNGVNFQFISPIGLFLVASLNR